MIMRFTITLLICGAAALLINAHVPEPLTWKSDSESIAYALVLLGWLSFIISGTWDYFEKSKIRQICTHALIWLAIFVFFALAHTYRFELGHVKDKVLANLFPGRAVEKPGMMQFQISDNGHFYIYAEINGVSLRFLVDTGASDIVLTPQAAQRVGIDMENLVFNRFYQTANGPGRGASIQLSELKIGQFSLKNIRASINESPMRSSLLGMAFFNRLKSYKVKDGILTLYW